MEHFRAPLTGFFACRGASWHEAQELAQDVFVQAYISQHSLQKDPADIAGVGAWLRGIAWNLFLNHRRKWARHPRLKALDNEIPEKQAESQSEDSEILLAAIQRLQMKHRQLICMFYLEENKVKEIASLLQISEETIAGRLYQARKELKRIFEDMKRNRSEASS